MGLTAALVVVSTSGRRSSADKRAQPALAPVPPPASTLPTAATSTAQESPTPSAAMARSAQRSATASSTPYAASSSAPDVNWTAPTSSSAAPTTPHAAAAALAPTNTDPNVGTVLLPAWTRGRRVYVDGHVVGEGPEPLHLRCGSHILRLGSAGEEQTVEVPCGGSVRAGP